MRFIRRVGSHVAESEHHAYAARPRGAPDSRNKKRSMLRSNATQHTPVLITEITKLAHRSHPDRQEKADPPPQKRDAYSEAAPSHTVAAV